MSCETQTSLHPQDGAEQPHGIVPWGIFLDNVWAHLRSPERRALVETCKDAFTAIRCKLQASVSLYVSRSLGELFMTNGTDGLKTRFPFATRLTLRYDPETMEEVDGGPVSNDEFIRTATNVISALGYHKGIKAFRLDYWDYLPLNAVCSLFKMLPSLESLEISRAYRLDLEALLLPGLGGLTSLVANAELIQMAPELLRTVPVLPQLRELRLSQLQVNDQPSDNQLCQALGALTGLTHLEMVTISAATRQGMVALKGIHNETLRSHPLARLPACLPALSRLRVLVLSDEHLERRTANSILGCLTALTELEELVMPEARVREEGWLALQQMTSLTKLHFYSIDLKGQVRAKASGSISWWRYLRLDDTCLPELAALMPMPGLITFVGTIFMRYGDGPIPPRDFAGMDRVLATLGSAVEVRLWLNIDCDVWPGLAQILGRLPGLEEVVARSFFPHALEPKDLAALAGAATRLSYLDLNNSVLDDESLRPLANLPRLCKVCLGIAARDSGEGHTPKAVKWLAEIMAARRKPALVVAPHLLDCEMEELEEWQAEEPLTRGSVTIAEALPDLELPPSGDAAAFAGPFFGRSGGGVAEMQGRRAHSVGGIGSGVGGSTSHGSPGPCSVRYCLAEADDSLILLSNSVHDFFRRLDL